MKRCRVLGSALAILTFGLAAPAVAQQLDSGLSLFPLFTDGVVLQRQAAVPIWGHASPGTRVTVRFRGSTRTATADAAGAWRVQLPPQQAGGPFELDVQADSDQVTLHDVLVGDVWVASGQSNMEFNLVQSRNGRADAAAAHDSLLRHFYVPNAYAPTPQSELKGGPWNPADSAHAGRFTAVGYYFARDLRSALKIPIGIIHTSWGGANIETWISGAGQGLAPAVLDSIVTAERTLGDRVRADLKEKLGNVPTVDSSMVDGKPVWADPGLDDGAWPNLRVPGSWESAGYAGLDGVAWYRTSFDLAEADLARPVRLVLGSIDDADVTWVNGTEVGRTGQVFLPRNYAVPTSALHAGRNVLAIRVTDFGGDGGVMARPGTIYLDVGGEQRPFAAEWKFRVARVQTGADGQRINKIPSFLYNAMVHPLLPYPIKGVIWYQGESNANNDQQARAYAALMKDIVASWRQEWTGEPRNLQPFPFLWVQLPNYMAPDTVPPATGGWALLRESQTAALSLPKTGQAITIDLGETRNIHPRNKDEVGKRLALVALRVAYGQKVEDSGPTYRSHTVMGNQVTITYDHAVGGLVSKAPEAVKGFAIAGADRHWVWAQARVDGERVILRSDQVQSPVAIRYAWGNSPADLTLYNQTGLPAVPFRTDSW